jgi:ubiquitin-protein ligase
MQTGPYAGGKFRLNVKFGYEFPFKAPTVSSRKVG